MIYTKLINSELKPGKFEYCFLKELLGLNINLISDATYLENVSTKLVRAAIIDVAFVGFLCSLANW